MNACSAEFAVNRAETSKVSSVQRLKQVEGLRAANLAQKNAVRSNVAAWRATDRQSLQREPAPSCPSGTCARLASNRTGFGFCIRISEVSSMSTIRSESGILAASPFSRVVFPVPVPPEMRMFLRPSQPDTVRRPSSEVSVPIVTSSSSETRCVNLRTVSVGPSTEHGGNIAATRDPILRGVHRASADALISHRHKPGDVLIATRQPSRLHVRPDILERTTAFHQHPPARSLLHHLGDRRIQQQLLDRVRNGKITIEGC